MAVAKFVSGPGGREAVRLDKPKVVFGRNREADCVLNHPTVSREHFFIERLGGRFLVVDNASGNGTFVNGERVSWVQVQSGDRVQAGPFVLMLELNEASEVAAGAAARQAHPANVVTVAVTLAEREEASRHSEHLYPREYLEGIKYFNAGRYFEAHEAWEEVWLRSADETKLFYQMLIQAAVGLHHYERGNHRGARGMYKAVTDKLARLPVNFMALDLFDFGKQFKAAFAPLIERDEEQLSADVPRPRLQLREKEQD